VSDITRLEVRQLYRYTYSAPIENVRQRLVMVPPDAHLDQRLISFALNVRGGHRWQLDWHVDTFGNRVCEVLVPDVQHTLEFEAHYVVDRTSARIRLRTPNALSTDEYLKSTTLTAADDRLNEAACAIRRQSNDPTARAEAAHDWVARAITYQVGATGVHTPAAAALQLGRGVCQDFAHLLLCVLRLVDVPARYVSGQLPGEGVPHAWVEAVIGRNVVAYDPTHHRRARQDYVTVAVGRDYSDVAPTSGTFFGSATSKLTASKHARIVPTWRTNLVAEHAAA